MIDEVRELLLEQNHSGKEIGKIEKELEELKQTIQKTGMVWENVTKGDAKKVDEVGVMTTWCSRHPEI